MRRTNSLSKQPTPSDGATSLARARPSGVRVVIGERTQGTSRGPPWLYPDRCRPQGDREGRRGPYQIDAVDEVRQFQILASVERIAEAFLNSLQFIQRLQLFYYPEEDANR